MFNAITTPINSSLKNMTAAVNGVSQSFTDARRDFRDRKAHMTLSGGRIEDVGMRLGAHVASGEQWCAKYIVGRGLKSTDAPMPSVAIRLKQHGVIGLGLRSTLGALGSLCRISPDHNIAIHLADVAMAALRFVAIGLAEAVIVAVAYLLSAGLQLGYDGAIAGAALAKRGLGHVRQNWNRSPDQGSDCDDTASCWSVARSEDEALGDELDSEVSAVF